MKVEINMGEGYTPVWSLLHQQYVPCEDKIAELGFKYEEAAKTFKNFADNEHDTSDLISAELYTWYMHLMDDAQRRLKPFRNQWWLIRHGHGLN